VGIVTHTQGKRFVKKLRANLGWSYKKLAEEIGVAHTTVMRWESGERRLRENNIRLLKILAEREGVQV